MERSSKKELLTRIENQEKALQKYKKRLHDVVESYKNLIKEKEALEVSVKVLTESNNEDNPNAVENENCTAESTVNEIAYLEDSNSIDSLKTSLRTLIAEKARIENELKTDRKKLLKEKDDFQEQLHQCEETLKHETKKYENVVQEMKRQIRDQQRDRGKEQEDHVLMLKELQSLVADERSAKERLEQQADNLKLALEKLPDKRYEYESCISELQNELRTTQDLLQVAEVEKKDMPSLLRQLQQEMGEMKLQHERAVEREIQRANEAEEKLKSLAEASEDRAANLELHLSELSKMVGNYDKLRQQDQISIQKLKDRVAQLDQENSVLARAVTHAERKMDMEDDYDLDIHALITRINKLKGSLRLAYKKEILTKKSNNISDFVNDVLKDDDTLLHAACQKEIGKLRNEIEEYKMQIQSVKIKKSMNTGSSSAIGALKENVSLLQEELQLCRVQLETAEDHYKKSELNFEHCINEMKSKYEREQNILRSEFQIKILELDKQLQKQRERSLKLIEDKDNEISFLKSTCVPSREERKQLERKLSKEASNPNDELCEHSSIDNTELSLLSGSGASTKKSGTQLLHYSQEIARNKVEISNLRKARMLAETALRELQQASLMKNEKFHNEIETLRSQMKRMEVINKGLNMEYLKNVFLRFVQSNDTNDRSHMINAIAAILHFTPHELQEIKASRHS